MTGDLSTLGVAHPERGDGPARMRMHRAVYAATTIGLFVFLALVVLDVRGPILGVDSTSVAGSGPDGIVLEVEHAEVTRPGLASPFSIEVTRPGGFAEPIEIAISRPWIEIWDENGFYPTPSAETGDADWVVYEFDPPDGERFRLFYDARLEPARQQSISGAVELREGDVVVVSVEFDTSVRP